MENKNLLTIIGVVAAALFVVIIISNGSVTGKAGYSAGESYEEEWFWDECDHDSDCDYGEKCIDHDCIETEVNLGVLFGCNPVTDEGTNLLDCSGFVANQALEGYGITAENVVLVGGFFTENSNVDLTRVWTKQGECVSNVEVAGMITDAVESLFNQGHSLQSLPAEDLNFKNPDTSLYCNLGNVEQFFDFGPFSDSGYNLNSVPSSKTVSFNFKAMFEDEVPNVVVCAISTQMFENGFEEYTHFLPNCWFWYPEGFELLPGLGACVYEEGGFSGFDDGTNFVCEDRTMLSCMSELNGKWSEGERCPDGGSCCYWKSEVGHYVCENDMTIDACYDKEGDWNGEVACADRNYGDCAPSITCPADYTIECTEELTLDMATASNNCGESDITEVTEETPGCDGAYTLKRTFTTTNDYCGNSASCTQIITVRDTNGPEIECPSDSACNPDVEGDCGFPTVSDACSDQIDVTYEDSSGVSVTLSNPIERVWTATDACGNYASCVQTIESVGACCIAGGPGCLDDRTEAECENVGFYWYEGEACNEITCPSP